MSVDGLPLCTGMQGPEVRDLQTRLRAAGFGDVVPHGVFGESTEDAVRAFQDQRGLTVDGEVGAQTWAALIEAAHRLGDRLLYLRTPMLRGDDVEDLQRRLGAIGFDARWVDGIFGPDTERAVREFQRNVGLINDGIAGPDTIAALQRLGAARTTADAVSQVRELDHLRHSPRRLAELRLAVGETGGADALARAVSRALRDAGATVFTSYGPDWSVQARSANDFGAEVFVALSIDPLPACVVRYFATSGFHSVGGARLAELCAARLGRMLAIDARAEGKRLPILRETRMPAVQCQLGPADVIVARVADVAASLRSSLEDWASHPVAD